MNKQLQPGQKVRVFDARLWEKNGGDSKTDSFFRDATIVSTYFKGPDHLADVRFLYDGRTSHGHFVRSIEE